MKGCVLQNRNLATASQQIATSRLAPRLHLAEGGVRRICCRDRRSRGGRGERPRRATSGRPALRSEAGSNESSITRGSIQSVSGTAGDSSAKDEGGTSAGGAEASTLTRVAYLLAVAIGVATPVAVVALHASGSIPQHLWAVFWWSSVLGATWEIPLMVPGCWEEPGRLLQALKRPPFLLAVVVWSCWDGLVALLGPWAVCSLLPGQHFQGFDSPELVVLVAACQVQSLSVEGLAAALDLWSYRPGPRWWATRLFTVKEGRDVVLWPQLIWLAASLVIYGVCLSVHWPVT